jgi:hypothetical protein
MVAPRRPRGGQGLANTFVGRGRELDWLQRAASTDTPRLALLVGEPGVGKTALVRELRTRLPDGTQFRIGRCLSYGRSVTYSPLADVLRQELGLREEDPPLDRLAGREILGLTLGLDVAGDLEPRAAVLALQDAWVRVVSEIGARGPAVLVLEDLHWATAPLVELLGRVLADATGPILLLGTTRPGREDLPAGEMLLLEPLGDDEAAELVDRALAAPLDVRARDLVIRRAEGNPFFIEELLSDLLDRGLLTRSNGGWVLEGEPLVVPESLQGLLAARIDLLPPAAKHALQAAAVIGRSFSTGGLSTLVGSTGEVRTLVERGFVRATEPELVFKHALTREVAYGSLPKAERARSHAAYAEWLEGVDARDPRAGTLAYHYAEAVNLEIAELAWRDRDDDAARLRVSALRWLRRAAELAVARFDLDDALALLHRAADLTPDDPDAWRSIGRVNALKFDGEAFCEAMLNAIELTSEPGDLGELYAELSWESTMRGAMWKAAPEDSLSQEWMAQALRLTPPDGRARGYTLTAKAMRDDDLSAAEGAVAIAEALDDVELLSFGMFAHFALAQQEAEFGAASDWARRRLELGRRLNDPDHLALIHWGSATAELALGRLDAAQEHALRHEAIAARLTPHHEVHALGSLLTLDEAAGRWDRMRDGVERTETAVAANAATPCVYNAYSLLACAAACAALGLDDEARRLEAEERALGFEGYDLWLDPVRARLALVRGDLDRVEELLPGSERWSWVIWHYVTGLAARFDALVAVGRAAEAVEEAERHALPDTYLEPFALRVLGVARGDPALLAKALGRFDAMGLHWHAAQTPTRASLPKS